ncbi:MAG: malto-oligosyltrehalose trehalohydrolase [Spirochaetaceae bacterium]
MTEYGFGPRKSDAGTEFRLWAPAAESVTLQLYDDAVNKTDRLPMRPAEGGWWISEALETGEGTLYHFVIDDKLVVPDPASRFQPHDVHGPSMLLGTSGPGFRASSGWRGRPWEETVLYELHLGTFTPGGTYAEAQKRLPHLAGLGITAVELMPLSDFFGKRNWGYDGVLPYAPDSVYGRPAELMSLIEEAHALGMMVFLDVVYNHFGPEGNYLHVYAPQFFTDRFDTPWGPAIDFSRPEVRRFFIENAVYWLTQFGFDGLRLDAVHAIEDPSETHILDELCTRVREVVEPGRHVHLVLENDANQARYLGERPGIGYDAQWNDDAHHVYHLVATGEDDGYYRDYAEGWEEHLLRFLTEGFVYQGEPSPYRGGEARGEASIGLRSTAFVDFLQNHDQVGNRPFGDRITNLVSGMPGGLRRIVALQSILLLSPHIPMLFMGEEWGSRTPFLYFCDYQGDLAEAVTEGRRREFAGFSGFSDPASRDRIPDPNAGETFVKSVLDWDDLEASDAREWLGRTRALLEVRRRQVVPLLKRSFPGEMLTPGAQASPLPGVVLVRWEAPVGTLTLTANLSEEPRDTEWDSRYFGEDRAEGEASVIWKVGVQESKDDGVHLGPWSVTWRSHNG